MNLPKKNLPVFAAAIPLPLLLMAGEFFKTRLMLSKSDKPVSLSRKAEGHGPVKP